MTIDERIDRRRSNECARKARYWDRRQAKAVANRMAQVGERLRPYRCRWCEHWHIGHRPPAEVIVNLRRLPAEAVVPRTYT